MFNRVFLILCGSLVAYTGSGYSLDAVDDPRSSTMADVDPAKALLLLAVVRDYRVDQSMRLTDMNLTRLADYANNSMSGDYLSLDGGQRADLARIIEKNAGRFPRATLDQFAIDQQRTLGMTDPDIRDLMDVVQDIRNGKALTKGQAAKVRLLLPLILKQPTAFMDELGPLTQYASMNNQLFTPKDLTSLRQASRDASGLTAVDAKLLMKIAQRRDNGPLTSEETRAIGLLLVNARIGSLNSIDVKDLLVIHRVVQNHSELFTSDAVRDFNTAYEKNQAIQKDSAGWTNPGAGPKEDRNDTTRGTVDEGRTGDQDMMNRPENMPARPMIQQAPSGARGR